jgi:hypothetical protein
VNYANLLVLLKDMKANTPEKYYMGIASRYLNAQSFEKDDRHPVKMGRRAEDPDEMKEVMALQNGRPLFPLPKGGDRIYAWTHTNLLSWPCTAVCIVPGTCVYVGRLHHSVTVASPA